MVRKLNFQFATIWHKCDLYCRPKNHCLNTWGYPEEKEKGNPLKILTFWKLRNLHLHIDFFIVCHFGTCPVLHKHICVSPSQFFQTLIREKRWQTMKWSIGIQQQYGPKFVSNIQGSHVHWVEQTLNQSDTYLHLLEY